jgi:hypothetical protein
MVVEAERVYGVSTYGFDDEGAICSYREGVFLFIGFKR